MTISLQRIDTRIPDAAQTAEELGQLGYSLLAAGEIGRAADAFRQGQAIAPRHLGIAQGLSHAYARQGKLVEAIAALEEAGIDPNDYGGNVHYGYLLSSAERFEEAETVFRYALRLNHAYPVDADTH